MKFGDKVRFRNSAMVRRENGASEEWWYYGIFHSFVAGGIHDECIDADGGDKIYCCRKPDMGLDRFQFCEKI